MSEKSANFHRLAAKRLENIQDAIRVLSNLSGPSYEWTADEVLTYLAQVRSSIDEAEARFAEARCWRLAPPSGSEPAPGPEPEPEAKSDLDEPEPAEPRPAKRYSITDVIFEAAKDDPNALAEMIVMQRRVIDRQAERIIALGGTP